MRKKILIFIIFFELFLLLFLFFIKNYKEQEKKEIKDNIILNKKIEKKIEYKQPIEGEYEIQLSSNKMPFKVSGKLYLKPPKKMFLYLNSFRGREVFLGSNDKIFWFWIKDFNSKAIYYANYDDNDKIPLKSQFNPLWILLNIGVIDKIESWDLYEYNEDFFISKTVSLYEGLFTYKIKLKKNKIDFIKLIDSDNIVKEFSQINYFNNNDIDITIESYNENLISYWSLTNFNKKLINDKYFEMSKNFELINLMELTKQKNLYPNIFY